MQVKIFRSSEGVGERDVIVMATDGLWDVVTNQVSNVYGFILSDGLSSLAHFKTLGHVVPVVEKYGLLWDVVSNQVSSVY